MAHCSAVAPWVVAHCRVVGALQGHGGALQGAEAAHCRSGVRDDGRRDSGRRRTPEQEQRLAPERGAGRRRGRERQPEGNCFAYQVSEYCDALGGIGSHVVSEFFW